MLKKGLRILAIIVLILPIFFVLYKLYIPRVAEFGCFDDCINYGGGYFMLHGKTLYSQIFYNHQPFMAYFSFFIQKLSHPINIYQLLLVHHQFILFSSFLFSTLLILRFKLSGIIFVLFYEFSKYYMFGDRFLAEGIIVYPIVYMLGLIFEKYNGKEIKYRELIITTIFTWFIVFMREPFVPAALLEFLTIVGIPRTKKNLLPYVLLFILSLVTIAPLPIKEYLFSIITVSSKGTLESELGRSKLFGSGIIEAFFYPLFILIKTKGSSLAYILVGFSVLSIFSSLIFITKQRKFKLFFIIFLILGLLNLRFSQPGTIFYAAYRMIPWYGAFLFFVALLISEVRKISIKVSLIFYGILILISVIYLLDPINFIKHKGDPHYDLLTNYGLAMDVGNKVKNLSRPDQTFFIDADSDINIAYIQSERISGYKYSWFVYFSYLFDEYKNARNLMFEKNPPDFYFGNLLAVKSPPISLHEYNFIYKISTKSGLFVLKKDLPQITSSQLEKAGIKF